jgi:hypothetical protein
MELFNEANRLRLNGWNPKDFSLKQINISIKTIIWIGV